jgi:Na+/proline symporter
MDTHEDTGVIHWVKTHKFWTSVIVLFIIAIAVRAFDPSISIGTWRVSYLFFFGLSFYYILIGGLIWSGYTGKKGMSMITLGVFSAWIALISWLTILSHWDIDMDYIDLDSLMIAVISTFLSVLLIYFGVKRYKNWIKSSADNTSHSS